MDTVLSIAIPTYNRAAKVRAAVESLIGQLRPGVEIVISDNASEQPASEVLADLVEAGEGKIRVLRNEVNIGMCPNIVRLFEIARGEWIWTLGDDDLALPDAVERILETVAGASERIVYHCFGCPGGAPEGLVDSRRFLATLHDERFMNNAISLSTGVYRRSLISRQLQIGHYWSNSYIPYTAMTLKALADGGRAAFFSIPIMTYRHAEAGQSWPYERLMLGIPTLLEIDGLEPAPLARFVARALAVYRYRPFVAGSVQRLLLRKGGNRRFWLLFFWRMTLHLRGVRKLQAFVFLLAAGLLLPFPGRAAGGGGTART